MTSILLFGANGQLGQELVAYPRPSDVRLIAHSRAETDIADPAAVEHAIAMARPDVVVNAAAYTKVDKAESEPDEAYRVNQAGPAVLASACAAVAIPLLHISTDYVFDGTKAGPYVETDATAPLGVYGASKLAGEDEIRRCHPKHVIIRTAWVYGRYGINFLRTILRLSLERGELRVVSDQRGSPTSTADLAEAVLKLAPLLAQESDVAWGTYHFTGEGQTNWWEFAEEILNQRAKLVGNKPKLTPITTGEYPTRARRPANSVLDNSLFRSTFGFGAKPWRLSVGEIVHDLLKGNSH